MAIQGTDGQLDSSLRQNLGTTMSSDSYVSAVGGSAGSMSGGVLGLGGDYAGIKEGFLTALDESLNTYIDDIDKKLDELEENPNILQAFKGDEVETAVKKLISAVKAEAQRYTSALKEAEKAIVTQVNDLYQQQSEAVGASMNADTSTLGN